MKKAKLVQVVFTTRVVVEENNDGEITDYENLIEQTKEHILNSLYNNEVEENIETIFDDEEVPYGSMINEWGEYDDETLFEDISMEFALLSEDDCHVITKSIFDDVKNIIRNIVELEHRDYTKGDVKSAVSSILVSKLTNK